MPRVFLRTKLIPELESLIQSESCKIELDGYALENKAELRDQKITKIIHIWEELELEIIPHHRYEGKKHARDKKEFYDLLKLTGGRF